MQERLQKLIARAGLTSRRNAEALIQAGQVSVNGKTITELGSKADAERDHIKVNGRLLRFEQPRVYLLLHKPAGVVGTMDDPEGRETLRDSLRGVKGRVFPVGRLGYNEQGLMLLTSDGELANRVLRHASRLPQTYWLKVKGRLSETQLREARAASGARVTLHKDAPNAWYEATFAGRPRSQHESQAELLQRYLQSVGHPVEKVKRVRLGTLELGSLSAGEHRELTPVEVGGLQRLLWQAEQGHPDIPSPLRPAAPRRRGGQRSYPARKRSA